MTLDRKRRIGVHEVVIDGAVTQMCIIEICDGIVMDYHMFHDEEPMTEWLGGTVIIRYDRERKLRAYRDNELIE